MNTNAGLVLENVICNKTTFEKVPTTMEKTIDAKNIKLQDQNENNKSLVKTKVQKKMKKIVGDKVYPLNSSWSFWLDRSDRGANVHEYQANLKKVGEVDNVRSFWECYQGFIPLPDQLPPRTTLHMMRGDRKPVWEEPYNWNGGTFRYRCNKVYTKEIWQELLLAAIGEQFSKCVIEDDEVVGISVSPRDQDDIVMIWNTYAKSAVPVRMLEFVQNLCPKTYFLYTTYKPHANHHAFEPKSRPSFARRPFQKI